MTYVNVTDASVRVAEAYVYENCLRPGRTSFLKTHLLARGAHFMLAPASLITSALDAIIGLGAGIGAICTLGKHQPLLKFAFHHLSGAKFLAVRPYVHLLHAINPKAKISGNHPKWGNYVVLGNQFIQKRGSTKQAAINCNGNGFTSSLIQPLQAKASNYSASPHFLKRHVASRLTYALLPIAYLVTKAVDGVISLPIASLSLLTGGRFESLNNLAYRTLQAPGIISALFYCTIKCINPWADPFLLKA